MALKETFHFFQDTELELLKVEKLPVGPLNELSLIRQKCATVKFETAFDEHTFDQSS